MPLGNVNKISEESKKINIPITQIDTKTEPVASLTNLVSTL